MRAQRWSTALAGTALLLLASKATAQGSLDEKLATAFDPARGLRADDVVARATSSSPDIRAKAEARAAAEADVSSAELELIPRVTLTGRYARLSAFDQPVVGNVVAAPGAAPGPLPAGAPLVNVPLTFEIPLNQTTAQAHLSIPVSDYLLRLSHKVTSTQHGAEAARHQETASRLIVATNARLAYYDWARGRLSVIVAEQGLEQAKQHLTDAKAALDAGSSSKADVLRAESALAQSELLLERARNVLARVEDRLRTQAHDDSLDLRAIGEDVRVDPAPFVSSGGAPALYAEALEKRHEIRAIAQSVQQLHEQAAATRALYWPRLDAFAEATYANPNQRIFPQRDEFRGTWSAGITLTWSPNDALAGGPSTKAVEAKESEAVAKRRALADQLRAEVVDAYHALEETKVSLSTARRGVAAAEEGHRVRSALYRAGRATGTELTDAETDLVRARLELVNAYIDARLARVRIAHAVGRDG